MSQNSKGPERPDKVQTLGTIARDLRQVAGLTRAKFGAEVGLSEVSIKGFESGRVRLTTEQLQKILRHSAMKDLHHRAVAAGIEPGDRGVKKP